MQIPCGREKRAKAGLQTSFLRALKGRAQQKFIRRFEVKTGGRVECKFFSVNNKTLENHRNYV